MLKAKEIVTFCEYMAYQIDAGVPVSKALRNCAKQLKKDASESVVRAYDLILQESIPLYEALDRVSVLPPGAISAIRAGESSGRLVVVFEEIADFYGRFSSIIAEATPKLLAPIGYIVFALLIFFGFIMFLFPMMMPDDAMNDPNPDVLVRLVMFGALVKEHLAIVSAAIVGLIGFGMYSLTNAEIRAKSFGICLAIPLIGRGIYELYIAMWAKFFSILQTAGVPYKQTLALTREMVPAAMFSEFDLLDEMDRQKNAELIQDDSRIPSSWPVEFASALQIGMPTGKTPEMLSKAADRLMVTGQSKINAFVGIANKLGLIFTAVLIAGLVMSVMAVNFAQLEL